MSGGPTLDLWASCPGGTEPLVAAELATLGWTAAPGPAGHDGPGGLTAGLGVERGTVYGRADLAATCRTLWAARTISRVVLRLTTVRIDGLADVAEVVAALDLGWLPPVPFAVRACRNGDHPFRSPDLARVAGTAVIDSYRRTTGTRLPVDLDDPRTVVRVEVSGGRLRVGLELTTASLQQRPWRVAFHRAGLAPTLAAALLLFTGWRADERLLDPMTGAGTVPIEAGLVAGRRRAHTGGLARLRLVGLDDREVTGQVEAELAQRQRPIVGTTITGIDRSGRALRQAEQNAAAAGLSGAVGLCRGDATTLDGVQEVDCVVTNPPYGVRVGRPRDVVALYSRVLRRVSDHLAARGRVGLLAPTVTVVRRAARGTGLRLTGVRTVSRGSFDVVVCRLEPG